MNRSLNIQLIPFLKSASLKRGAIFGSILITALLAFELFNYGTTSFALQDVLGNLKFGLKTDSQKQQAAIYIPEQGLFEYARSKRIPLLASDFAGGERHERRRNFADAQKPETGY